MPDEVHVSVANGLATAAGLYKQSRVVVFLQDVSVEVIKHIEDKGRHVLVMKEPAAWPQQFSQHPQIFGAVES
jgi:hypothetical protein